MRRCCRRRGLTVVECLLALTILSVTVLAATTALSAGAQHDRRGDRAAVAARLGRDMLEEVTSRAYREPVSAPAFGPEFGETTRAAYDDVDDYHGLAEARGAVANVDGAPYTAHEQGFTRGVTVTAGAINVAELGRSVNGLTVVVTLTSESGERFEFTRFIPEP
jgi:prepilin-type N-terminal cleavage/methylation domain-containing protein